MTRDELLNFGFKELPHYTVMDSLMYDLGRNRFISIGSVGTPNEMVFLCERDYDDNRKINDLICLKNYDYDGYTDLEDIKSIIKGICSSAKSK
jgi:hypothetical protein